MVNAAAPTRKRLPGWFVHLAEEHDHVLKHTGFLHFAIELFAFAAALANAAEDAHALLMPDHVVDHLGQQHRLADAGAAEQSRFTTRSSGTSTSIDLDARFEELGFGGTFC